MSGVVSNSSELSYQLGTNALARAARFTNPLKAMEFLARSHGPGDNGFYQFANRYRPEWAKNCWLSGARGLSATCLGYSCTNHVGYEYMVTMISPRHWIGANHLASFTPFWHGTDQALFLGTNGVRYWRHSLAVTNVAGTDISVGILDSDLPPAVGFLAVLPGDYTNWLSSTSHVQGIGVTQDYLVFGEGLLLSGRGAVLWSGAWTPSPGLGTNWSSCAIPAAHCYLRAGDSSDPVRLLIGNQLVLVSGATSPGGGPDYAHYAGQINSAMHALSVKNGLATDYQLRVMSLTNWARLPGH